MANNNGNKQPSRPEAGAEGGAEKEAIEKITTLFKEWKRLVKENEKKDTRGQVIETFSHGRKTVMRVAPLPSPEPLKAQLIRELLLTAFRLSENNSEVPSELLGIRDQLNKELPLGQETYTTRLWDATMENHFLGVSGAPLPGTPWYGATTKELEACEQIMNKRSAAQRARYNELLQAINGQEQLEATTAVELMAAIRYYWAGEIRGDLKINAEKRGGDAKEKIKKAVEALNELLEKIYLKSLIDLGTDFGTSINIQSFPFLKEVIELRDELVKLSPPEKPDPLYKNLYISSPDRGKGQAHVDLKEVLKKEIGPWREKGYVLYSVNGVPVNPEIKTIEKYLARGGKITESRVSNMKFSVSASVVRNGSGVEGLSELLEHQGGYLGALMDGDSVVAIRSSDNRHPPGTAPQNIANEKTRIGMTEEAKIIQAKRVDNQKFMLIDGVPKTIGWVDGLFERFTLPNTQKTLELPREGALAPIECSGLLTDPFKQIAKNGKIGLNTLASVLHEIADQNDNEKQNKMNDAILLVNHILTKAPEIGEDLLRSLLLDVPAPYGHTIKTQQLQRG